MRLACIDVGSNTTRLLVADVEEGRLQPVRNERAFTLLGAGLAETDVIRPAKLAETAEAVTVQAALARATGAERLRAVATAAIRRATNAGALVEEVERRTGIHLEILAGDEEARLAFRGAAGILGPGDGTLAVADVGGGSTEIAFGDAAGEVGRAVSLPFGSAVLAARFLRSDPPSGAELEAARSEVRTQLAELPLEVPDRAAAVGGSAGSLARLAGDVLGTAELEAALAVVRESPAAQLAERFALEPVRVRLLPAGLAVLAELQLRLERPLRICKAGLREGVVWEMTGERPPSRRPPSVT